MGFSVSGSAVLIFVAAFIGFGMFYTATATSFEQITDARGAQADNTLEQQNTEIQITDVRYNEAPASGDYVNVTVENTGSTELAVGHVDVLFDSEYQTGYRSAVGDDTTTDLWLPQETLELNATVSQEPSRVKIVTGPGIAVTEVL